MITDDPWAALNRLEPVNLSGTTFNAGHRVILPPTVRADIFHMDVDGNGVALDKQLMKVAETDTAHELVIELTHKYLGLFRTAIGKFAGAFKDTPAHVLGAVAIRAALERAGVQPEQVDEVIMGQVGEVGPDAFNARRCALEAGLPTTSTAGRPRWNSGQPHTSKSSASRVT